MTVGFNAFSIGKFTILCILILKFLDRTWEDSKFINQSFMTLNLVFTCLDFNVHLSQHKEVSLLPLTAQEIIMSSIKQDKGYITIM
jgi:hypothetical protein